MATPRARARAVGFTDSFSCRSNVENSVLPSVSLISCALIHRWERNTVSLGREAVPMTRARTLRRRIILFRFFSFCRFGIVMLVWIPRLSQPCPLSFEPVLQRNGFPSLYTVLGVVRSEFGQRPLR